MSQVGSSPEEGFLKISEMFPDIPLGDIRSVLKSVGGDVERSIEELLSYNMIEAEKTQEVAERSRDDDKTVQVESAELEPATPDDEIMSLSEIQECLKKIDFVEQAQELLRIKPENRELLEYYAARNHYKLFNTVLDVLENFDPSLPPENQRYISYKTLAMEGEMQRPDLEKKALESPVKKMEIVEDAKPAVQEEPPITVRPAAHSRVQGGYRLIAPLSNDENDDAGLQKKKKKENRRGKASAGYVINAKSDEMKELQTIRRSNSALSRLPDSFFVDAMKFFHGDVDAVAYVASNIAPLAPKRRINLGESAREKPVDLPAKSVPPLPVTVHRQSAQRSGKSYPDLLREAQRLRSEAKRSNDRTLRPIYASAASQKQAEAFDVLQSEQRNSANSKLIQARRTNQIDFHGLDVNNAINSCKLALSSWWKDEMQARVSNGDNLRSVKALRVEDFRIITGRGLHSAGGVPRIKLAVRKYLKEHQYIFDEEASGMTVTGRRHP
ncbi:DEKNAAC104969 [Brettanomyces naardenensis]|uniref:DEKNAAC104969 n=1 Tax=Brettanomyces naardenensis TaxID=13370 RepID=A0A448YS49_BRENA|nr:DEKNAAC104969 [Brettanomyces naardenensis]